MRLSGFETRTFNKSQTLDERTTHTGVHAGLHVLHNLLYDIQTSLYM